MCELKLRSNFVNVAWLFLVYFIFSEFRILYSIHKFFINQRLPFKYFILTCTSRFYTNSSCSLISLQYTFLNAYFLTQFKLYINIKKFSCNTSNLFLKKIGRGE